MPTSIYIETTIPSAYYNTRTEPEFVAQQNWTREWWDEQRHRYTIVSSLTVIEELQEGKHPLQAEKLAFTASVPLLQASERVKEVVVAYVRHHLMPSDPGGDALHLALASVHRCDILLTWNCRHLANYNKVGHIRRVNEQLGLHVPAILTRFELLEPKD